MKVGIDAKRAYHNKSGLGNYSRDVINSLIKDRRLNIQLFTTEINNNFILPKNIKIHAPKYRILKNYWRSFQVQHNPRGRYTIEWDKDDPNDLHTMYGMESNFTYPVDHKSTNERMPLVNVHPQDGKEFIFYQYVYFDKLWKDGVELTSSQRDEVEQELQDLVVRSRFIDNFVFRKGDLLIMDQLYTMHRRSPIRDTNRLLWRTAFDYQHIKW